LSTAETTTQKRPKYPLQLTEAKDATWIFVSNSSKLNDVRHLNDIIWYVDCLRSKNVPEDKIHIFQDHPESQLHFGPFDITKNIHPLSKYLELAPQIQATGLVFVVFTGHGSHLGIHTDGDIVISPSQFVNTTRKMPGLSNGVLVVGQCYAGIFDFLEATDAPEICCIGATRLHISLSAGQPFQIQEVKLVNKSGKILQPWYTNVFLFYFFDWIREVKDIDGDGAASILDGFKYAGAMTNNALLEAKAIASIDFRGDIERSKQYIRDFFKLSPEEKEKVNMIEFDTHYVTATEGAKDLLHHQEPWILHANLLRSLALK